MKIICIPCGYNYEETQNFETLNDSWHCPDCGGSINNFAEIDVSLPETKKKFIEISGVNVEKS